MPTLLPARKGCTFIAAEVDPILGTAFPSPADAGKRPRELHAGTRECAGSFRQASLLSRQMGSAAIALADWILVY